MATEELTPSQFQALDGLWNWRVLTNEATAWFPAPSHAAGAALVRRAAELTDTPPDLDLRANGVRVCVGRHDTPTLTKDDVAAARAISGAAAHLGLAADPSVLRAVELTMDALDAAAVMPFWRDTLGYEAMGDEDLVDPMHRHPGIWFQPQDRPRPLRNRIHLDIARPHEIAVENVKAGRLMHRGEYYATLADAEGNEADIIPLIPDDRLGEGPETEDWRVLFGAMAFYPDARAELVAAVAELADEASLPLLVDLRADGVTIDTGKDRWEEPGFPELAGKIQAAARGLGLTADPTRLRFVQFGIDAMDVPAVREFWRAVLGYENDPRPGVTDIFDPLRLAPPIIFQQLQEPREQRNRIHVDLWVPNDQAQARVDAALAAGGRIVYGEKAPEWWTIADPEGNELDIAVMVHRH